MTTRFGLIRYPGSKAKIADRLIRLFPQELSNPLFQSAVSKIDYREPFFGGGAVGFRWMDALPDRSSVWINDIDPGMAALWMAVKDHHRRLIEKVDAHRPSVADFDWLKKEDGRTDIGIVEMAFRKLVLNRESFSGLGAMAGGPIGGRKQRSDYNVDCRWNAGQHCRVIAEQHKLLTKFQETKITCVDFAKVIDGAPEHAFIYADPPYVEKGGQLYKHNMTHDDHRRLATALRNCPAKWLLSYDDHPLVRELYPWADFHPIDVLYTGAIEHTERRKNHEVAITPKRIARAA